jgi:hypothetical protein
MTNSYRVHKHSRQLDASANTSLQGSRGLDVVLACVEEGAILVEGVAIVLVACVSCRVGVAKCARRNVPLPANCRYEAVHVRNAMRGVGTHASRNGAVRLIQVPPQKSVPDWNILCI